MTYVAAHSLHARPLVVPPGADVIVWNRTATVEAGVLVDGHRHATLGKAERAVIAPRARSAHSSRRSPRRRSSRRYRRELCFVGCASRTSSSSARRTSRSPPGLNAITGETGAGKTIFAQAIGLLLGARADASAVGAEGTEAYVEAELDVPDGFFDEDEVAALAELRPEGEAGLVLARRVFGDGRTRAYAWGRAVAREDVAAAAERLLAMSGQFEQRRLARPSFQLDVLDAFCGAEQLERRSELARAWRELAAARRRHDELTRDADAVSARLAELEALVDATEGMEPGDEEALQARRERLRHVEELAEAASGAAAALAPEEGEGASSLAAQAERALAPLERLAPELASAGDELRDLTIRLREVGSDLYAFLASLDAEPGALDDVEGRLERIADLQAPIRRGLLRGAPREGRGCAARARWRPGPGHDPVEAAAQAVAAAASRAETLATELARRSAGAGALVRRGGRRRARLARHGRRRVPRRAARARPRAVGCGRSRVPRTPERRPAVRTGRGDRLRR